MMVRFWACVVAVVGLLPGSAGRLGGLPKALPVPMVPAGTRCTHEGRPVACFNLTRGDREACAREVSPRGRWAVVSVFDCHASFDGVNARGGQDAAGLLSNVKRARENGAEFVLALPRAEDQAVPFPAEVRAALEAAGATVETVGWVVPPNLSKHVPVASGGCCGAREFMKLHAFGMTRYDAVLLVDTDVRIARNASLAPLLGCAADGYFLSTRGTHSACDRPRPRFFRRGARARASPTGRAARLNGGHLAFPPSAELLRRALAELRTATLSKTQGWNHAGWGPFHAKYDARMQGFLYWLFHQRRGAAPRTLRAGGTRTLRARPQGRARPRGRRGPPAARPDRPLRLERPPRPRRHALRGRLRGPSADRPPREPRGGAPLLRPCAKHIPPAGRRSSSRRGARLGLRLNIGVAPDVDVESSRTDRASSASSAVVLVPSAVVVVRVRQSPIAARSPRAIAASPAINANP